MRVAEAASGARPEARSAASDAEARNQSMQAIEARIKSMTDSVSGAVDRRWFAYPPSRALPRLAYGVDTSLQERAAGTLKWIFAFFNVPPGSKRVQPAIFAREFDELTAQHTELWTELINVARTQRDAIVDAEEQDRFAKRLEESERRIAYSHEVMFCAGMVWKHLVELLYLQCREGGNIYDAAVPDRMRISDQRAWDVRRMLSDPVPLEEETGQKKTKDMQLVLEHLLARASHERYRKRGNMVYQQKCVDHLGARYPTSTWVPACFKPYRGSIDDSSMESFVLHYCKREHYPLIWEALVRCLPVKKIVDFMVMCDEPEFPTVYPKRNLLAFRNGIYDTCAGSTGCFYEYGSNMANSSGQAAAKYFDSILPLEIHQTCCEGHDGWWNIETPLFQSARPTPRRTVGRRSQVRSEARPPPLEAHLADRIRAPKRAKRSDARQVHPRLPRVGREEGGDAAQGRRGRLSLRRRLRGHKRGTLGRRTDQEGDGRDRENRDQPAERAQAPPRGAGARRHGMHHRAHAGPHDTT